MMKVLVGDFNWNRLGANARNVWDILNKTLSRDPLNKNLFSYLETKINKQKINYSKNVKVNDPRYREEKTKLELKKEREAQEKRKFKEEQKLLKNAAENVEDPFFISFARLVPQAGYEYMTHNFNFGPARTKEEDILYRQIYPVRENKRNAVEKFLSDHHHKLISSQELITFAIEAAADYGLFNSIKTLMEASDGSVKPCVNINTNAYVFRKAAEQNSFEAINYLVTKLDNLFARTGVVSIFEETNGALLEGINGASSAGHIEMLDYLLSFIDRYNHVMPDFLKPNFEGLAIITILKSAMSESQIDVLKYIWQSPRWHSYEEFSSITADCYRSLRDYELQEHQIYKHEFEIFIRLTAISDYHVEHKEDGSFQVFNYQRGLGLSVKKTYYEELTNKSSFVINFLIALEEFRGTVIVGKVLQGLKDRHTKKHPDQQVIDFMFRRLSSLNQINIVEHLVLNDFFPTKEEFNFILSEASRLGQNDFIKKLVDLGLFQQVFK